MAAISLALGCGGPTPEQFPTETALPTVVPTPTVDPVLPGLAGDIVIHNRESVRITPGELSVEVWSVYEVLNATVNQSPDPVLRWTRLVGQN